jgi:mono/diheme cytochrome c family protein
MSFHVGNLSEAIRDFRAKLPWKREAVMRVLVVKSTCWLGLILVCATTFSLAQTSRPGSVPADAANSLQPFISSNCYTCHSSQTKTAGLDLESAASRSSSILQDRTTWENVLAKLKSGQMPPKGTPRPEEKGLQAVIHQLEGALLAAETSAKPDPGHIAPHRLNRTEYNNTVRDLLGVGTHPADDFPQDDSVYGFDNIADSLTISSLLMEKYMAAAEKIADTAIFGPDLKPEPVRIDVAIPRRMETTNSVQITTPAYYSMSNYDVTGLSQPGSYHLSYQLPVTAEYVFRITGAGNRPAGSEPTQVEFWVDGKIAKTYDVANVGLSGFERRPDFWEARLMVSAGTHDFVVTFPRQFDGLPAKYGGPNPSKRPEPPGRGNFNPTANATPDPQAAAGAGRGGQAADNRPGKIEERRIAAERAKQQAEHPTWNGLSVNEFDIIGPYNYTRVPSPESKQKVFTCSYSDKASQPACIHKIVSDLAARAFRRPLAAGEAEPFVAIAESAQRRSGSFEHGVSVALRAILVSPDFLFRIEKNAASGDAPHRISNYELASRLSYFLWSSMPDAELTMHAADGSLNKPDVLRAEVKRMLSDPKSSALADNFADEWLEVRRLESITPDRDRFPDFDDYLRDSMKQETELFIQNLLHNDGSILDLIDGKYTFLNERLAGHYGIPGVKGTEFRKVDLTGTGRSGVLTQGSVLTVSSYATRTSVVLRGKWVLENFLNAPPPPPPPNVPGLDASHVGTSASLRQVMEQHRANPVCASCHTRMDPLGFSLENYDAVGSWRDQDGQVPVDSSGVLPDGRTFKGADGLKAILRSDKDAFANGMASKLLTYGLGRGLESYDRPVISQIVQSLPANGYRLSSLVLEIVNSLPFQMQRGAGAQ